ncbi:MAG TPA: DinB family protein [Fimbriimonadaceae bacterium]|nr:DinB family protein [Fimbriimonadaceae bacterium]
MTVQDFIASGTEKGTADLLAAYERTTPEKRGWQPEGGRSARNVLAECAIMTDGLADIVQTGKMPEFDMDKFHADLAALDTDEKAISALKAGTDKLVKVIKALPDDKLSVLIESPWGTYTTAAWAHHVTTHNAYHEGQINYIQTLYGDKGY